MAAPALSNKERDTSDTEQESSVSDSELKMIYFSARGNLEKVSALADMGTNLQAKD